MDYVPNGRGLVQSFTSLLGHGRPTILRLTLLAIVAIVLFQLITFSSSSVSSTGDELQSPQFVNKHASWTLAGVRNLPHNFSLGRVLVTGGGGNIGKHIVRRLLAAGTPVTILDTVFYQDELELSISPPSSSSLLQVHIGDIRNITALSSVFTPNISGVVHLAAISRIEWCIENEKDCSDINERGTQMVLDALTRLNRHDRGKRWFILASSLDIYGDKKSHGPRPDKEALPSSVLGATKLAAEKLVKRHVTSLGKSAGRIHAAALRLSNVYGGAYDHLERLLPSIATRALSHHVIQVFNDEQRFDLLHIDDCVDAFLLTIGSLTQSLHSKSFFASRTSFQTLDIASGTLVSVEKLLDSLVTLTHSKSPIRRIPRGGPVPTSRRGTIEQAWNVLGFRASIGIDAGLMRLVRAYLRRTETFLRGRIEATCGDASPSIKINANLEKLDDCIIHTQVNVQGEFQALITPDKSEGGRWSTTNEVALLESLIYKPEGQSNGFRIGAKHADRWLGVLRATPGSLQLPNITLDDISHMDPKPLVDWEFELKPHDHTAVRLVLPGTDLYLMPPTIAGGNFSMVSKQTRSEWPFRISPICCKAPGPWPFFRDDPIEYTLEYQRTSLERPFLASSSKAVCSRLERALSKVQRELAISSRSPPKESRRRMSRLPTDWINANTPACLNLCDHPTLCVDTGDCQCIMSACVHRQRHHVSSFLRSGDLSFPPSKSENLSLVDMVERSSWRNVLRPQASNFVGANVPFPRIHLSSIPEAYRKWNEENDVYKLDPHRCFTADSELERAARLLGVKPSEAEMTFVPHYQARPDTSGETNFKYALETVEGFDVSKVIMPFTNDWGQCMHFDWDVWRMRKAKGSKIHFLAKSTIGWSVMADLNSPCYWPHQDVAIPPRSCHTPELFQSLSSVANVRPARDRRVLVTFSGSPWGTGMLNRLKLGCPRVGWDSGETERRLHPDGPKLRSIFGGKGGYNYIPLLNDTIFCPQAGGIAGWTWRIAESIYSGCIPVLIGQKSHYPFFDVIDWGKISISVNPSDLDQLEDILLSRYTLEDIERLQTNVMLVRSAFVYPLDDANEDEVKKIMIDDRGPLWFALHSTKMRMLTIWPTEL